MAAVFPYTLTLLSSTISNKGSVDKRDGLLLRPEGWYEKSEEVAVSRVDWVLMRKQLSYAILIRCPSL